MRSPRLLPVLLLFLAAVPGWGDAVSFTGALDPDNPNDFFKFIFQISSAQTVVVQGYGYGGTSNAPGGTNAAGAVILPGGFDTYLSLFAGGDDSATFLDSNDDSTSPTCAPPFPDCRDSGGSFSLTAGTYTLVLGAFGNMSFAENYGTGTLGDGFIGLGSYYDRTSSYALDISADHFTVVEPPLTATPEPGTFSLCAAGLLSLSVVNLLRKRKLCHRSRELS